MDTQLIIVTIIGVIVAAIILRSIYRFFFVKNENSGYCVGCTGCSLSKDWEEEEEVDPYTAYLKQE